MPKPQRYHENHSVLYLASGARGSLRESLTQFRHRTLVDHMFRESKCELRSRLSRLEMIRGNAEDTLIDLYLLGRKYDCLIIANEGLWEGGGCYPLHRGATMGLASLVLGNYYIHVTSPSYYGDAVYNLGTHLLDLPFVRDEIDYGDEDRIETRGVSNSQGENIRQWRMARIASSTLGRYLGVPYQVHWKSVWHDADQYDAIFLSEHFAGNFWHRLKDLTRTPVLRIRDDYASPYGDWADHTPLIGEKPPVVCPVEYSQQHGFKRIAVVPNCSKSAYRVMDQILHHHSNLDLNFYHLRSDGLIDLYPSDDQVRVTVPGIGLAFE